ncbi:SDR family oxidoreductase [Gluconacetobacter asukensis]|uniref:SDR family oxidoreductase n=1 Tax=Gluconacetobacter asukensis TaxID=1017181 RepID=A0A7W4J2T5_9PROT|nr:SDR family oxidoreductase [Gluconacetobacter asukensis]MBB2173671.1 SDR family oxidoreductase [Gluconacetobacter asukensis]
MSHTALVVGATGIVGQNLAARLVAEGWTVYGLARRPRHDMAPVLPVAADLLDPETLRTALADIRPSHVYFCSWMRHATEEENCRVNSAMVRNVFAALAEPQGLRHAALTTGMKHYLGPFESYASGVPPETPFREEMPRLPLPNFYYDQEDALYEASEKYGFSWSVHRPHTIIGYAIGNAMNMGTTLAVYASICRETGRPFVFPGSPAQWHGLTDLTDARQLASQLLWAGTRAEGGNQAFNIVNGDVFRWKWLWPRLAAWFGLEAAPYPGQAGSLEAMLSGDEDLWAEISRRHGLKETQIGRLASAWHTDADLGRPVECVTDMSKSRRAGFTAYQYTPDSFFDLFMRLRAEKLIP